jgi:hypothetical protein
LFKIDASRCDLQVGDHVSPGQLIGEDAGTGKQLKADRDGLVTAISFSGADHALLVLVKTKPTVAIKSSEPAHDFD